MEDRKSTICPKYVKPGNRCRIMLRLERCMSEKKSGAKQIREIFHKEYCAWDCYKDCVFYRSENKRNQIK